MEKLGKFTRELDQRLESGLQTERSEVRGSKPNNRSAPGRGPADRGSRLEDAQQARMDFAREMD